MTEKCPTSQPESNPVIRILMLEGDQQDADLLQRKLDAGGLETETVWVDSREAYERALEDESFDLILCDSNVSGYDSAQALNKASALLPNVPVIVISSPMSEKQAINCLHLGARDYVYKNRLDRFIPKVKRALHYASGHQKHHQSERDLFESEARFHQMVELLPVATYVCDLSGRILDYNRETVALWGRRPSPEDRFCGSHKLFNSDGTPLARNANPMAATLATGEPVKSAEVVFERSDGSRVPAIFYTAPLKDTKGDLKGAIGCLLDISTQKQIERERLTLFERERDARHEAEAAQRYFRSLFESAPGLYLVLMPEDYKIVGVSEAYLRSTRTRRENIIGKHLFEVFPAASHPPDYDTTLNLRASLERVKRSQQVDVMGVQHYPIPRPASEGGGFEERYWNSLNSPVLGPDGELAYIIHRVEDVTDFIRLKEREKDSAAAEVTLETRSEQMEADIVLRSQELQRLNDQLQESEKRFRELAENIEEVFFDFDPKHNQLLYVSPAYETMWGQSREDLYADPQAFMETIHPEDLPWATQELCRSVAGENVDIECRIISPDGEVRWVQVHCYPVGSADGEVVHIVGTASDITVRKLTDLKLARSNRALRMISACNEAIIRAEDENSLLKEVCQIAVDIGGYQMAWAGYAQNDPEKTILPVAHAGDEAGYLAAMNLTWSADSPRGQGPAGRTIRSAQPLVLEDITQDPSFESRLRPAWQRGYRGLIALPLRHEQRTFGLLTLYSDEIRPVDAEEVKFLQGLTENLAYGIGGIRSEQSRKQLRGAVLKVAAAVSASTGMEFFQQLVRNMTEALGAKAGFMARMLPGEMTARTIAAVVDGEVIDNFDYLLTQGPCIHLLENSFWMEAASVTEQYPESPGAMVNGEAYVGMRLSRANGEHLGQLFVIFSQPLEQTDFIVSTLKIFAARAAAELERREADARIGEQASLLDKAHDAIIVTGMDNRILFWNKGAESLYGWPASEALGGSVETLLFEDSSAFQAAASRVLSQGEWRGKITQRHQEGQKMTVEGHWTLVRHEDGRPKSILAINSDISQRLAVEEQLQQAQRLNAVGELTGGVAHDFNNLLTVILGNSELVLKRLKDQPELRALMEMTQTAAQRGARLTHRLLAFSRQQVLDPRATDVNALISGMGDMLRRTLREDISIQTFLNPGLWHALVDPAQLEAALLNLCLNARDAMDTGGELAITTANVHLDQRDMGLPVDLAPGPYVMIKVADTGKGVAAADLKRVFEPFFTTKATGEGTGLGLSIVYGFIKQSKGHITIDSETGQGTQVTMFLPKVQGETENFDEVSVEEQEVGGAEKILLVEDDDLVRNYAESALRTLGYSVIIASDGPEALDLIRENEDIDLLFTDVIMPGGLNGPELVEAAHKLRPGLKVLYTSGYTENALPQPGSAEPPVQILNKPYSRLKLARKIRAALSAP